MSGQKKLRLIGMSMSSSTPSIITGATKSTSGDIIFIYALKARESEASK